MLTGRVELDPRALRERIHPEVGEEFVRSSEVVPGVDPAYGIDHLPTDEELLQLAERWRPYRSLAVSYLFASEYDGPASAQA